jgi:hypothetical protein
MKDQHFNKPVNSVAGRDYIEHQHNYSSEGGSLLGPQQWVTKDYVAGTAITSGWLAFSLVLAFLVFALLQVLWAIHDLLTHAPAPNGLLFYVRFVLMAAVGLIAGLAVQVSARGFAGIPKTQIGIARDIHRHVFIGQLGGEGSLCPRCHVKLHFHDLGASPILRCTRNRDHCWAFDFTSVKD